MVQATQVKTGMASPTLGGIDSTGTGNGFWASTETAATGTPANLTLAQMATLYNDVSVGNDQPTIVITSQSGYEAYEALLQPQLRYTDATTADAGFQNLLFKGAPVTFDSSATSGTMYMLNNKYLRLVAHSDVWFKPTPFVRPTNQDARFAQILCYGNLTVTNRARQGKLTGIANA